MAILNGSKRAVGVIVANVSDEEPDGSFSYPADFFVQVCERSREVQTSGCSAATREARITSNRALAAALRYAAELLERDPNSKLELVEFGEYSEEYGEWSVRRRVSVEHVSCETGSCHTGLTLSA